MDAELEMAGDIAGAFQMVIFVWRVLPYLGLAICFVAVARKFTK